MGDLAKYIAEVIEFVVAGVLVLFSLLLMGYVVVHPDLAALPTDLPFLTSLGGLLPVVGVALIYALGILAEGISRIMFEHGLGELTADKIKEQTSKKDREKLERKLSKADVDGLTRGEAESHRRDLEVDHYVGLREEWRMYVLAHSASLNAQVDGQLKRLRIERAAALSGGISSLALLLDVARTATHEGRPVRALVLVGLVLAAAVAARVWLVRQQVPVAPVAEDDGASASASTGQHREEARATAGTAAGHQPGHGIGRARTLSETGRWERVSRWFRDEVRNARARALAVVGAVLALGLLVDLAVEIGTEDMSLRAALLVAIATVTSCAVALSIVRLERYVNSIIRCYLALTDQTAAANERRAAKAAAA